MAHLHQAHLLQCRQLHVPSGNLRLTPCFTITTALKGRGRARNGRRVGGMAVAGIVGEAVKGAVHEAWAAPNATPVQRAVLFFTLLALIAKGVWGNLTLIRYATYAYWLHSSLRPWKKDAVAAGIVPDSKKNALIARNIRYGAAHRSL